MDLALTTFLNPSGLSYVGQSYYKCFTSAGIRVVPIWLGPPELPESIEKSLAEEMLSASLRAPSEKTIQFHAGRADDLKLLKSKSAALGSIVLEGNKLQNEHIRVCKALDLVFVPAYFCRNVCVASGVPASKIAYLPYALDTKIWNPAVKASNKGERFRFLYMNTCYERKGWDVLLRAFWQEFSADDPVELIIKSYREKDRMASLDILIALEAAKLGVDRNKKAPIIVMDHVMTAAEIPSFMKSADAFVSPHRSEGFGLNIWHAMALGVPVIATDYGGNTDFTKADTSWLVQVGEMSRPSPKEVAIFKHYAGITWAEPDLNDLRRQMRTCMTYRDEAAKRAELGAKLVARNYCFERVLSGFEQALKKTAPGTWEKLCMAKHIESLAKQPTEKFESCKKPLTMIEI